MLKSLYIFCLLIFPQLFHAQEKTENKDVKVGLVLSGGGAKGLAHIGALKVIEEAGVKIDYIAGTSMGAIVGALYASGYTAKELDSIFKSTDFQTLIQDNVPRSAKTFYEKEDSERYALTLPFNKFKISIPQAISGGQSIYNEFVRLLYHVKDIDDFSKLQIPFVCMATDVETGDEVLLNKGYLPEAILASGTFPSLFRPVEINGRVLIDGGVVNNYPIGELKKMGADIVIGVDVQHGLSDRESLLSATEILLQINNYRTVRDMEKKSALTDIYITPDIKDYSVIDFDMGKSIIDKGEEAARLHIPELLKVAAQPYLQRPKVSAARIKDTLYINELTIQGNYNYSRAYIKGKLRFNVDDKITFNKLQQGINNLSATGNFRAIKYELLNNGEGVGLLLNVKENPDKMFIRLGVHFDDLYKSAGIVNLTRKNVLMDDDVASIDMIIGDNLRYNLEYYVDKGFYWSFGINSRFDDFNKEIDFDLIKSNFDVDNNSNIRKINLSATDLTNQVYVQTVIEEEFSFTLGLEHKLLKYSTKTLGQLDTIANPSGTGNKRTYFEKSNYYSTYGQLTFDTYDDIYFPTKGLFFDGDFHFYVLSSDFNNNFKEFSIGKARMGGAFSLARNIYLNLETEGGFKWGISPITSLDFVLGGYGTHLINNFIPFYGYDFLSLVGNSYVKAYARLDYEFVPKNHILLAANLANVGDDLFRTADWFKAPAYSGYGLGYGFESFIGPIQVFYSYSPEIKENHFYFSIGYWF
ncbi:patatin-like phospholipase family protein [Arenibacter sp. BSSL-BM3]|uniref:Patatin-like phospholipase family protein n=1 Tax=Arenibacter arenosicollis TaxID=2762274 RepID=A0ABR7QHH7_9FLAO|nr:patatin-like phospholipase family protein [Arenibacter arenosicollis]MBC8766646.1 patatin-like phospholipase family protein [Arenibacter arenosicollis]